LKSINRLLSPGDESLTAFGSYVFAFGGSVVRMIEIRPGEDIDRTPTVAAPKFDDEPVGLPSC
jgi:hypothetical protein